MPSKRQSRSLYVNTPPTFEVRPPNTYMPAPSLTPTVPPAAVGAGVALTWVQVACAERAVASEVATRTRLAMRGMVGRVAAAFRATTLGSETQA